MSDGLLVIKGGTMQKHRMYWKVMIGILVLLSGCSLKGNASETIFQYKDSYIGDNSAVVGIIEQLRNNEQFEKLSLETKKKPYGMIIDYKESANMSEKAMEEAALYNATFLFALIKNAEWVIFDFKKQKFTVTKKKFEKWYGTQVENISNEKDLKNFAKEQLNNQNRVNEFFKR